MNPELEQFKNILRKNGSFATKQRVSLFKHLQSHTEIHLNQILRDIKTQDQATIYRNVKLFEELGIINRLQMGWHSRLELSGKFHDHHHHMTCTNCGEITAWEEDPTIELRIQTVALKQGFMPKDHQLEIRGLCKNCQ